MKNLSNAAATLGRKGGKATTDAKVEASRENGQKGGRPKGSKNRKPRAVSASTPDRTPAPL
jgi:hypothetical protein